jgi:hypothetical protein
MTAESSAFANFLLSQLRVAGARAKLVAVEADSISAALASDFIGTDDAIAWANDAGVLGLFTASSAVIPST